MFFTNADFTLFCRPKQPTCSSIRGEKTHAVGPRHLQRWELRPPLMEQYVWMEMLLPKKTWRFPKELSSPLLHLWFESVPSSISSWIISNATIITKEQETEKSLLFFSWKPKHQDKKNHRWDCGRRCFFKTCLFYYFNPFIFCFVFASVNLAFFYSKTSKVWHTHSDRHKTLIWQNKS